MLPTICQENRIKLPGTCCKPIFRISRMFSLSFLMHDIIEIHFSLFWWENDIGSDILLTQNCGYVSGDRKFSLSKGIVIWIF